MQVHGFSIGRLAFLAGASVWISCGIIKHTVNITLSPGSTFTISSTAPSVSGVTTTPITVSPASAGNDYTSNQSKVDSATLTSMTFNITPHSDNLATQLSSATVVLTDTTTNATQTYTLGAPLIFASPDGGVVTSNISDTITQFTPDPTPFITALFKSGDSFTVSAAGTSDHSPVDIDVTLNFAIALQVGEP